jgi:hypothetical protein
MVTGRMGHISVFCSYAREDAAIRDALGRHLEPLRAEKVIDDWNDSEIRPGARWDKEIRSALDRSRLVIFIVTPDLLASDYVNRVELARAIELERAGKCQVVPIVARATDWGRSPLADFQALPGNARPIDSFGDEREAWAEITTGLREVCKRIVDWENPYKRAQVGDWTHFEQTMQAQGQSITGQGTVEVIEKTPTLARVKGEIAIGHTREERTITIDLTEPLEDRLGDMMKQIGQQLPANAEVWIGPSQYEDDVLFIGGQRYECVKARRRMRIGQQGQELEGLIENWRCLDVPLDGIVKGTGDFQVMRQTQVLLGYGHGNAATAKPRLLGSGGAAGSTAAPSVAIFSPGRWKIDVHAFGVGSEYDLLLHPNGLLQGRQGAMGMVIDVQGQWGFDMCSNVLTLKIVAMMMGMPAGQDVIQVQLVPAGGGVLQGADAMGRQFRLVRIG